MSPLGIGGTGPEKVHTRPAHDGIPITATGATSPAGSAMVTTRVALAASPQASVTVNVPCRSRSTLPQLRETANGRCPASRRKPRPAESALGGEQSGPRMFGPANCRADPARGPAGVFRLQPPRTDSRGTGCRGTLRSPAVPGRGGRRPVQRPMR